MRKIFKKNYNNFLSWGQFCDVPKVTMITGKFSQIFGYKLNMKTVIFFKHPFIFLAIYLNNA
jgi:hypothetical protein